MSDQKPIKPESIIIKSPEIIDLPNGTEVVESPEQAQEGELGTVEGGKNISTEALDQNITTTSTAPIDTSLSSTNQYDVLYDKVESILEEELEPYYNQMDPLDKDIFQKKGEQTSQQITKLLLGTKNAIRAILELILKWLKSIRGVSAMFIEEMAKRKTQKILGIKEEEEQ